MRIWIPFKKKPPVVSVIRFSGTIAAEGRFGSSAISDQSTKKIIEKAFAQKNISAVAIVINSPGGSPVLALLRLELDGLQMKEKFQFMPL